MLNYISDYVLAHDLFICHIFYLDFLVLHQDLFQFYLFENNVFLNIFMSFLNDHYILHYHQQQYHFSLMSNDRINLHLIVHHHLLQFYLVVNKVYHQILHIAHLCIPFFADHYIPGYHMLL